MNINNLIDGFFSLTINADGLHRTISIKIAKKTLLLLFVAAAVLCFVFVSSIIYSSHVTRKLFSYEQLKIQAKEQKNLLDKMNLETEKIILGMKQISDKENQVRKILGLRTAPFKYDLIKDKELPEKDLSKRMMKLQKDLDASHARLEKLTKYAQDFRANFSRVPSVWPAYGRIMSTYGFRIFPWRGMHTGIDINTHYGAPIRSAASGIIEFAGWKNGYGRTVIVDHGRGIETLYGHASGFAVREGQQVKKGDIIAYVGTSGYATGPHVHYEVIKFGIKINPARYLNMNMLSANEPN